MAYSHGQSIALVVMDVNKKQLLTSFVTYAIFPRMPNSKKPDKERTFISGQVDTHDLAALKGIARDTDRNVSQLLRQAVHEFIERHEAAVVAENEGPLA
jgi:hypothetical protein